jgi:prepilin-type processing-associated H-X9-DG protein
MKLRSRPAFTLFQLLLTLALLAFLAAMLFPAILKVRQAAARAQSSNNLKQIALACHIYLDANQHFPSGNDGNNFSAAAQLLPYIEQDNVFKQIDFTKPSDDKANLPWRGLLIKTFMSPEDPQMVAVAGAGPTNYLFCAGSKYALADNDGIFYQDSKVKIADITDGTSNTLFCGETLKGDGGTAAKDVKRQYVSLDKDALKNLNDDSGVKEWKADKQIAGDRCSAWIDGRFLQCTFSANRMANDDKPDVSCAGLGGLAGLRGSESIVNVAMADGSVRAVTVTLKLDTWKNLANKADGNVIDGF